MAPGAEVGAAGRAHVLEAVRLFSDDFGPLLFPCSSEVRSGFASAPPPPPPFLYLYILSKVAFENAATFLQGSSFSS